jgi:nucleoside-diphosphate-sugar epimerase
MIIAITGGSGYIGQSLYKKLAEDETLQIKILDITKPSYQLRECDRFIQGDISDKKSCLELVSGADIVFHNASENRAIYIPNFVYFDVNEKGTKTLLEACLEKNVKNFIFKSTDKVYGRKYADDDTKPKPRSFFAKSKFAAENAIEEWSKIDGNRSLILRTPVVIGAGNRANMYNFIRVIEQRRKPFYLTTDKVIRSITSLTEFIDAVSYSIKTNLKFIEKGNFTCNIVSYPQLTIKQMHNIICEELNIDKPKYTLPLLPAIIAGYLIELLSLITRRPSAINGERVRNVGTKVHISAEKKHLIGYSTESSSEQCIREITRWYKTL